MKNIVLPIALSVICTTQVWGQTTSDKLAPSAEAALAAWKKKQDLKTDSTKSEDKPVSDGTATSAKAKKLRELPKIIVHREDEQVENTPVNANANANVNGNPEFVVHDAPKKSDADVELPWRKPAVPEKMEKIEVPSVQAGIPGVTRPSLSVITPPPTASDTPIQWQRPRNTSVQVPAPVVEEKKVSKTPELPGALQEALNAAKQISQTNGKDGPTPVVLPVESNAPIETKKQIGLLPPPMDKKIRENTSLVETPVKKESALIAKEEPIPPNRTSLEKTDAPAISPKTESTPISEIPVSQSKVTTVVLDKSENEDPTLLKTPIPLKNVMPQSSKSTFKTIKLIFIPKLSWDICQNLVQTTNITEQLVGSGYIHGVISLDNDHDENSSQFMIKALSTRYNTPLLQWKNKDDDILPLMDDLYKTIEKTPGDTTIVLLWDAQTMGTLQHTWVYGLGRSGRVTADVVNKIRGQMPKWDQYENQRWDVLTMRWREDAPTQLELQSNKTKPTKTFCAK